MNLMNYEYESPSDDLSVLHISSRLINEFINEEMQKFEGVNNRANISICLIGIYSSIIISIGGIIFSQSKFPILIFTKFIYLCIIMLLMISIYNSLKVILVTQMDKLAPSIVNDVQTMNEKETLQYEIKWKMWQYNQYNQINIKKLFYLHRTQRALIISTIALLITSMLLYFNPYIFKIEVYCYFKCFELIMGCFIIILSVFSNQIIEKFDFWKA